LDGSARFERKKWFFAEAVLSQVLAAKGIKKNFIFSISLWRYQHF
jgi:hypothetical protein